MRAVCFCFLLTLGIAHAQEQGGIANARALGSLRAAEDVPRLLEALASPDRNARFYAAYALGEIKDPSAGSALLRALRDPEWCVRDQAAWALRELRDPKLIEPLTAMLKETGADLSHLIWLLQQYGAKEVVAPYLPPQEDAQADALAAHWSFDDRSTTVAKDVTGRAVNGEIKGCTVTDGKTGAALRFGKGAFVELGRAAKPSVAHTPFTIMAWIKAEALSGVVVARGGAACGYSLYLKDGLPKFGIRRSAERAPEIAAGVAQVGTEWTHLAGVVMDNRIELYVNGKLAGAAKSDGCLPGNGGQGMEIGFDAGNSAVEITDAFVGAIDEVKQFNAALPEDQIAALSTRP